MSPLGIVLLAAGVVLLVVGLLRAREPWSRYRDLKAQDENVKRYEAWRGGVRSDEKTGASVAMAILLRRAQIGAGIAVVGGVLIVAGLLVR
jgi:hypothetical protein